MTNYERKASEIVEGAKELNDESLSVYLDLLIQRGLLAKEGDTYAPTDTFRLMLLKCLIAVLQEMLQAPEETKQKLLAKDMEDLLLDISLRAALEIVTEKAPSIGENGLECINWKEVGGLTGTIYSFLTAGKEELKALDGEIKKMLEEGELEEEGEENEI